MDSERQEERIRGHTLVKVIAECMPHMHTYKYTHMHTHTYLQAFIRIHTYKHIHTLTYTHPTHSVVA